MAPLRNISAEKASIAAARKDAIRQSAMMSAIANRKSVEAASAISDAASASKATLVTAPATAASSGTAGQIAYDSSYFYVCISANTWKRAAISTW